MKKVINFIVLTSMLCLLTGFTVFAAEEQNIFGENLIGQEFRLVKGKNISTEKAPGKIETKHNLQKDNFEAIYQIDVATNQFLKECIDKNQVKITVSTKIQDTTEWVSENKGIVKGEYLNSNNQWKQLFIKDEPGRNNYWDFNADIPRGTKAVRVVFTSKIGKIGKFGIEYKNGNDVRFSQNLIKLHRNQPEEDSNKNYTIFDRNLIGQEFQYISYESHDVEINKLPNEVEAKGTRPKKDFKALFQLDIKNNEELKEYVRKGQVEFDFSTHIEDTTEWLKDNVGIVEIWVWQENKKEAKALFAKHRPGKNDTWSWKGDLPEDTDYLQVVFSSKVGKYLGQTNGNDIRFGEVKMILRKKYFKEIQGDDKGIFSKNLIGREFEYLSGESFNINKQRDPYKIESATYLSKDELKAVYEMDLKKNKYEIIRKHVEQGYAKLYVSTNIEDTSEWYVDNKGIFKVETYGANGWNKEPLFEKYEPGKNNTWKKIIQVPKDTEKIRVTFASKLGTSIAGKNGNDVRYSNNVIRLITEKNEQGYNPSRVESKFQSNGWNYFGEVNQNGRAHGRGIYISNDGRMYTGYNSNGQYEKFVHYMLNDGSEYIGEAKDCKFDGFGLKVYKNGALYLGEWKNSGWHGEGIYLNEKGNAYYHRSYNNSPMYNARYIEKSGVKVIKYNNGCSYYGQVNENGLPNGIGILKNSDGKTFYAGTFKNNSRIGIAHYIYDNGEHYFGEVNNGQRDGSGIYVYQDNTFYHGQWKEGNKNGSGMIIYPEGAVYFEQWANGKPVGSGGFGKYENNELVTVETPENIKKVINDDGTIYFGEVNDEGKIDGEGFVVEDKYGIRDGNLSTYAGKIKNGSYIGEGHIIFKDKSQYFGKFENGIEEGYGMYLSQDGYFYAGNYVNGKKDGNGISIDIKGSINEVIYKSGKLISSEPIEQSNINKLITKEGSTYYGEVNNNGIPQGKGIAIESNGMIYAGEFEDGKYNGYGHYVLLEPFSYAEAEVSEKVVSSGHQYLGQFKDGKMSGKGKMIDYRGAIMRLGKWKNGLAQGPGVQIDQDDRISINTWVNGWASGNGDYIKIYDTLFKQMKNSGEFKTLTYEDGSVYIGKVDKDGKPTGKGKMTFPNGTSYIGNFKDGVMDGIGTLVSLDEKQYKGEFKRGKMSGKGKIVYPDGSYDNVEWKNGKLKGGMLNKINKVNGFVECIDGVDRMLKGENVITVVVDGIVPDMVWDIIGVEGSTISGGIINGGNEVLKAILGESNLKDVNRFIGDTRTGVNKVIADPLRNLFDDAKKGLKKFIF